MFVSKYKSIIDKKAPILISFFAGDEYYHESARTLVSDISDYNISYDICEFQINDTFNWSRICEQKIKFYQDKLMEYKCPVFWVDVDTRIINDPSIMMNSNADIGIFLRNFKYIHGFDPYAFARLFHPGYILFNYNETVINFMEHMRQIATQYAQEEITDDFILQEGLNDFEKKMRFDIFPPDYVLQDKKNNDTAIIKHSNSGNINEYIGKVLQHENSLSQPSRQKFVLNLAYKDFITRGERVEAVSVLKRIRRLDPNDRESFIKMLKIYKALGETGKYNYHFQKSKLKLNLYSAGLRFELSEMAKLKNYEKANSIFDEIIRIGNKSDINISKTEMFELSLEERADLNNVKDSERINLWWWKHPYPGNLGDIINPYIIEKITGKIPRYTTINSRLICIGSIIKFAKDNDIVWGTGASAIDNPINKKANYLGVRGPITRDLVINAGGECDEIYGDPAWILPYIFKPSINKKYKLGVITHWIHDEYNFKLSSDVKRISIRRIGYGEIEEFITEMNECEAILSTSLHGVIIANAYQIPVKYCSLKNSAKDIHGDGIKFKDYFLSIGRKDIEPLLLNIDSIITSKFKSFCTDNPEREIDIKKLMSALPEANIKF